MLLVAARRRRARRRGAHDRAGRRGRRARGAGAAHGDAVPVPGASACSRSRSRTASSCSPRRRPASGLDAAAPRSPASAPCVAAAALVAARAAATPALRAGLAAGAGLVALHLGSALLLTPFDPRRAGPAAGQRALGARRARARVAGLLRDTRALRLAGLALLGVAAAKVFLADLASLDALYRVGSFLALGLLLLARRVRLAAAAARAAGRPPAPIPLNHGPAARRVHRAVDAGAGGGVAADAPAAADLDRRGAARGRHPGDRLPARRRGAAAGGSRTSCGSASTSSRTSARPSRSSAPRARRATTRCTTTARETAAVLGRAGFSIITGGGPGIMEAGNRGARDAGAPSIGLDIELPHEQFENAYVDLGAQLPLLLRAQGHVRPLRERVRRLPGRLRHARRAVRGRDAAPDRQDPPLPDRPVRLGLLERARRLAARHGGAQAATSASRTRSAWS